MAHMSHFARTVFRTKYAMELPDGTKEDWNDTADRVVSNVLAAL